MSQDLIAKVQELYAAFGRGDIPAVLEGMTDDVDWGIESVVQEVPWYGLLKGRTSTLKFFQGLGEGADFHVFNPHSFVTAGDQVFNLLQYEATMKRSGKRVATTSMQHWTFRNGKVAQWRSYEDTARIRDAYKG